MPYLLLSLSALFWSGNFVLSRGMHTEIPPVGLAFWRWALALLLLLPFAWRLLLEQRPLIRQHRCFLFFQGLLGVSGFNTLIYLAMHSTTAINAVLVNSCIPVIIVLVSWIRYRERLSLRQYAGVLVSLGGVLLIMAKGDVAALRNLSFNQGDLLVLGAALVWALYSSNLKEYPRELHPLVYLSSMIAMGLVVLLPLVLLEMAAGQVVRLNLPTLLTIGYVAVFASVLAFICWNRAVREVGANRAGPFIHLMPVFSTILAIFFLGEALAAYHIRGMVLVFGGIFLTTFSGWKKKEVSG